MIKKTKTGFRTLNEANRKESDVALCRLSGSDEEWKKWKRDVMDPKYRHDLSAYQVGDMKDVSKEPIPDR